MVRKKLVERRATGTSETNPFALVRQVQVSEQSVSALNSRRVIR